MDMPPVSRDPADYGRQWHVLYDLVEGDPPDDYLQPQQVAGLLAAHGVPDGASVLEVGAGTGRIAVPLSQRFTVTALDASAAMLQRLAAKDHAGRVRRVVAPMQAPYPPAAAGPHAAVVIAFNTLLWALSERDMVATLAAATDALRPGGVLVVEIATDGPEVYAARGSWARDMPHPAGRLRTSSRFDPGTGVVSSVLQLGDRPPVTTHVRPVSLGAVAVAAAGLGLQPAAVDGTPTTVLVLRRDCTGPAGAAH